MHRHSPCACLHSNFAGRLATLSTQLGMSQATTLLYDLSRGITGMSSTLGGEVCAVLLVAWQCTQQFAFIDLVGSPMADALA